MYQKKFHRHNNEIKDNIFDKKFILHNRTHEEVYKYMFIFLFFKLFTRDSVIRKGIFFFVLWIKF